MRNGLIYQRLLQKPCRVQETSSAMILASLLWHAANSRRLCAGQGYIWLAHRDPASAAWQLAQDSCTRWQRLLQQPHLSPSQVEWQDSGSLLLATDAAEAEQLRARQELLGRAGISARYLDERALRCEEPALHDSMAGGLLVSNDSQLVRLFCQIAQRLGLLGVSPALRAPRVLCCQACSNYPGL